MRMVCVFEAALGVPIERGSPIAFADRSFSERIGWREIVVEGSGVAIEPGAAGARRCATPARRRV